MPSQNQNYRVLINEDDEDDWNGQIENIGNTNFSSHRVQQIAQASRNQYNAEEEYKKWLIRAAIAFTILVVVYLVYSVKTT